MVAGANNSPVLGLWPSEIVMGVVFPMALT